jgi:hypothetical protein
MQEKVWRKQGNIQRESAALHISRAKVAYAHGPGYLKPRTVSPWPALKALLLIYGQLAKLHAAWLHSYVNLQLHWREDTETMP